MIQAEELFYSRVEPAYSPENRAGYQVVYRTPGLSTDDVREIESKVKCFEASRIDGRYQYFHLRSGRVALAVSREIDDIDTRITDRTGRSGAFVAHCLVLSRNDFLALDNNPFVLFNDLMAFAPTPQEMVQIKEAAIPSRSLDIIIPESPPDYGDFHFDVAEWSEDEFTKLWLFAADAAGLLSGNQSVLLVSDDNMAIYEWLRLVFQYLPQAMRFACTFNSFVDGCVPMPGNYWAVGSTRREKNANYLQALLDRQRVNYRGNGNTDVADLAKKVFQGLRRTQGYEEDEQE